MDDDNTDLVVKVMTEYMPYVAAIGAIFGAVNFCNGHVTAVFEALFTPVVYAVGFAFVFVLTVVVFGLMDLKLNTEGKKIWGMIAVIIIATIVTVKHVL